MEQETDENDPKPQESLEERRHCIMCVITQKGRLGVASYDSTSNEISVCEGTDGDDFTLLQLCLFGAFFPLQCITRSEIRVNPHPHTNIIENDATICRRL